MRTPLLIHTLRQLHSSMDFKKMRQVLEEATRVYPQNALVQELLREIVEGSHPWQEGVLSSSAMLNIARALESSQTELKPRDAGIVSGYPTITIVTPVFNQRKLFEACLRSVIEQAYPALELIVMDGGSTDGTVDVIREYEKYITCWSSGPDDGPYAAVQAGFERSSGEIMGWLNADDMLHPGGLFNIAKVFSNFSDVRWAAGRRVIFNEIGMAEPATFPCVQFSRSTLLRPENLVFPYVFIMQEGTYWRRSLWEEAGSSLDLNCALAADFELWARFSRFAPLHQTDYLFGGFRSHSEEQRSKRFWDQYLAEATTIIQRERQLPLPDTDMYHTAPEILAPPESHIRNQIFKAAPAPRLPQRPAGPPITMVTIALEDKRFLQHCVESVRAQLYEGLEHIIIDVEPTQESKRYLERHGEVCRVESVTRSEMSWVLNSVLTSSRGEFMHIASASSKYDPHTCLAVAALFAQNPAVDWIQSRFYAFNDAGEEFWQAFMRQFCRRYFLKGNFVDPMLRPESVFWRRSLWEKAGSVIDTRLSHAFEVELWMRFSRYARLYSTPHCLAGFHWPAPALITEKPIEYLLEMKEVVARETAAIGPTSFDTLDPPELLTLRQLAAAGSAAASR